MLDKAIKDMLVERAVDTIRHFWNETGGELQLRLPETPAPTLLCRCTHVVDWIEDARHPQCLLLCSVPGAMVRGGEARRAVTPFPACSTSDRTRGPHGGPAHTRDTWSPKHPRNPQISTRTVSGSYHLTCCISELGGGGYTDSSGSASPCFAFVGRLRCSVLCNLAVLFVLAIAARVFLGQPMYVGAGYLIGRLFTVPVHPPVSCAGRYRSAPTVIRKPRQKSWSGLRPRVC